MIVPYVEPEVEVIEIPISKDGILTAISLGAMLAGDCDTLIPVRREVFNP